PVSATLSSPCRRGHASMSSPSVSWRRRRAFVTGCCWSWPGHTSGRTPGRAWRPATTSSTRPSASVPDPLARIPLSAMDLGLTGARALVTAASKGLGRACAQTLVAEGARVFIVSRDDALLSQVEREIGAVGHLAVDLSEPEAPAAAVEAAVRALGGLDILVCNAGGPPPGTFE